MERNITDSVTKGCLWRGSEVSGNEESWTWHNSED